MLPQKPKKIYQAPQLFHYGSIANLTQTAAGFSMDNPGMGMTAMT